MAKSIPRVWTGRPRSKAEATVYALGIAAGAITFSSILLTYRPTPAEIVAFQQEQRGARPGFGRRMTPRYGDAVRGLFTQDDIRGAYQLSLARLEDSPDDDEAALFAALAADRLRLPERGEAWERLRAMVRDNPEEFGDARRDYLLGWAARGLGEISEAERRFSALVASSARLVAPRVANTSEGDPVLAGSGDLYNLACYLALAGEADAALDMFDAAVQAGWTDAAWPAADPDLETIREHPRFKAALDRTWANIPSAP
ncbi:MAG: hypothetical protein RBS39_10660 [Phycisphaerales bacterium]|nr:hypothetical protein [Phycisphaerales bacterium]